MTKNKFYAWGCLDGGEAKDARLNQKLSIPKFVLAFGIVRDVLCSVSPSRREELDLYVRAVVHLGYKYRGFEFYEALWTPSSSLATLQAYVPCS